VAAETQTWTIKAALDWTQGYLAAHGDAAPSVSALWLIGEACGLSRVEIYMNLDRPLSVDERACLRGYVAKRAAGEPLQYITGHTTFRYITLEVGPGVLIPRPETEVLVSEALSLLPAAARKHAIDSDLTLDEAQAFILQTQANAQVTATRPEGASHPLEPSASDKNAEGVTCDSAEGVPTPAEVRLLVADICTGSGCIALSIAHENSLTNVIATDISAEACALARKNTEALGLTQRVATLQCDLAAAIPEKYIGNFDLVVSNPPYIPTEVMASLPHEVSNFEPELALHGGRDGLDFYRRLLKWAKLALKPNCALVCELHETCLDAAKQLALTSGFKNIKITNDLANKPRVITAFNG
jgi:release factor glutamine methyltransferase